MVTEGFAAYIMLGHFTGMISGEGAEWRLCGT